jgi:predicted lipoprotein with Yx(FWY)xxD motif
MDTATTEEIMNNARSKVALLASLAATALAAAACSSSGASSSAPAGSSTAPAASTGGSAASSSALLKVEKTSLGSILADGKGDTIYGFAIDTPNHSACSGVCAQYWPPVPAPATLPSSIPGVSGTLGSLTRSDGTRQLTVDKLPVYTYKGDSAPGMANGQGKNLSGGLWWVVDPTGKWVTTRSAAASNAAPASTGGGGGGYGY